nr:cysteine-rich CWC family protein [Paenibacillus allorhizosphaerae]
MTCPLCGRDNDCGNVAGKPHGTCWCSKQNFPKSIFELVKPEQLGKSCICKTCLERFKDRNGVATGDSGGSR